MGLLIATLIINTLFLYNIHSRLSNKKEIDVDELQSALTSCAIQDAIQDACRAQRRKDACKEALTGRRL